MAKTFWNIDGDVCNRDNQLQATMITQTWYEILNPMGYLQQNKNLLALLDTPTVASDMCTVCLNTAPLFLVETQNFCL